MAARHKLAPWLAPWLAPTGLDVGLNLSNPLRSENKLFHASVIKTSNYYSRRDSVNEIEAFSI
ncbi:hypothetical protein J6590_061687 [Homalodisca vitripennis]|nr:hypothetical protein J6590_061687 [Homalodisca vitripennis]